MPVRRTEAFVLRTYRVGEADKVAVFFAREAGKLRGMARGARRPRSRFGAGLEVATEIELTYFEKEGRELVSVDRCDIIRPGFQRSGDPLAACVLAYFAELVDAFAPEREPSEKLYRLLRAAIGALEEKFAAAPAPLACYFEAWLLRLFGYYPRAETCAGCGGLLVERGATYRMEEHQVRCAVCARAGIAVSGESLRYLEAVWRRSPAELEPPPAPEVLKELAALHRQLIVRELDRELRSLTVLEELLRGSGGV